MTKDCACTPAQIHRYLSKISGPLLDRIDLHVDVPEVKYKELTRDPDGEPSKAVAKRVTEARKQQINRFKSEKGPKILCNAQMGPQQLQKHCALDEEARKQLEEAILKLGFSARAYDRILKVSRTIADLDASKEIRPEHVAEAIQYRSLDRNFWESF